MKSSDSSSATASPSALPSGTPPRKAFALSGRSISLDPLTHAVRPDLADMRLADRVFAPHYAQPVFRRLREPATLREARDPASPTLVVLDAGASFELLDLIGDDAWGVAPGAGAGAGAGSGAGPDTDLVGYLPAATLAPLPVAAGS